MKRSVLFLIQILLAILVSCNPGQSTEQQTSDSTSVASDPSADSLSTVPEAAQTNEVPEEDIEDHDPSDYSDHRRDGISANISQYKFLGFSEDLNYAAFVIGWRADGGPDITAKLYVVNVDKNDFVGKPVTVEISNGEVAEAVKIVIEKAASHLSTYRIPGQNTGTSYYVDSESNVNIPFDNKIYKLRMIEKIAPDANKFFELQVLTDGEPIILQSDSAVPKNRGNVVSYRVVALFVLEDKIAVIVEYNSPDRRGFENKPYYNARQLIVTGSLVQRQE